MSDRKAGHLKGAEYELGRNEYVTELGNDPSGHSTWVSWQLSSSLTLVPAFAG